MSAAACSLALAGPRRASSSVSACSPIPEKSSRALFVRQLEKALHLGEPAHLEMADLPHRSMQRVGEGLRHDQRAVELAAQPFDPARQIDVWADHGEVQAVARTDIAVADRAVMQGDPGAKRARGVL